MQPLTMPISPRCPKQLYTSQNSPRQPMQVVDLKQCEAKWKNIIKDLQMELDYTQQKVKHLEQEYEELASIAQGYKEQINQLKQTIVQLTTNNVQNIVNEHYFHIESPKLQQLVTESKEETKQLINCIVNENEHLRNWFYLTQSKIIELENKLQSYQKQNLKDKQLVHTSHHKNFNYNIIQQDVNKSGSKNMQRLYKS